MDRERVITVEYLVPSMCQQLLCKFPDHSAFGFDYSQSEIWSPLLPRGCPLSDSAYQAKIRSVSRVFSPGWLRRVKDGAIQKKKKKKTTTIKHGSFRKRLEFSPNPTPKRGWKKLLKAAAKRFDSQKMPALKSLLRIHET